MLERFMPRTVDPAGLRRFLPRVAAWTIAAALGGCAGGAEIGGQPFGFGNWSKRSTLVREDVTAILEGMAAARGAKIVVLRAPDYRSSRPSD